MGLIGVGRWLTATICSALSLLFNLARVFFFLLALLPFFSDFLELCMCMLVGARLVVKRDQRILSVESVRLHAT